jgi:coniferyl-aldehyde dehydrogenase
MTIAMDQASEAVLEVDAAPARLQALLDRQRSAFLAEGPPSAVVRRDRIDRLSMAVLEHADDLAEAPLLDFGNRPLATSIGSDVLGSLPDIDHARQHPESWMAPQPIEGYAARGLPTIAQHPPKGVVGVIGPWNFPVSLVITPAVEALAAGNRVMIRVSEIPARTGEVLAAAIAERMSSEEVVVVLDGPRERAASTRAQPTSTSTEHEGSVSE